MSLKKLTYRGKVYKVGSYHPRFTNKKVIRIVPDSGGRGFRVFYDGGSEVVGRHGLAVAE